MNTLSLRSDSRFSSSSLRSISPSSSPASVRSTYPLYSSFATLDLSLLDPIDRSYFELNIVPISGPLSSHTSLIAPIFLPPPPSILIPLYCFCSHLDLPSSLNRSSR
ncbi:hypothetical protein DFH28DRAFT_1133122 [Melampsora americana]|nr:hypothetical protein DFH28DRAFT_1133122 [Melampsora americana]